MGEQEVSLRDYIRVIKKRKKTILLLFFIAVISSAVVSFFLPPVYEATLAMKIGDIIDVDTLEKELIESPIAASQFLKGPQILIEAIKELKLPYTLEEIRKKILVEPVRETEDLVQIKVDANDPGEVVNIANYLGTKLLERHKEIKKSYESKEAILVRHDEQIKQINEELDEINKSKVEILAGYDQQITGINKELDEINKSKEIIIAGYDEQIQDINEELGEIEKSKEVIIAGYDEQIQDINEELGEIEKSKEAIIVGYDENILSIDNQLTLLKDEIDNLKKEMTSLEIALEALFEEIERKMAEPGSLSDAEASVLVGRLQDMGTRWEVYSVSVVEREQRYGNLMEKLREAQVKKIEFKETKDQRYDTLTAELREIEQEKTRFQTTKDQRYNTLTAELREIEQEKTRFQTTKDQRYNTLTSELRGIEQEKTKLQTTKEQRYDTLTGELRQAQMEKTRLERVDSVEMYNTEVLAAAEEPKVPVRPNKLLNILVAGVVGLIIGLGLVFSLEYFEKTD